jgi:hypothetical protein
MVVFEFSDPNKALEKLSQNNNWVYFPLVDFNNTI